ncbi:MAG: hypothetical protein H0U46_09700 [Actinobacteria bacterium]|nr:hypothetical protein [Actinomycetota bacterium]
MGTARETAEALAREVYKDELTREGYLVNPDADVEAAKQRAAMRLANSAAARKLMFRDLVETTRRLTIGTQRYVDTGTGWRKLIETKSGGTTRLTRGEAAYVENVWGLSGDTTTEAES